MACHTLPLRHCNQLGLGTVPLAADQCRLPYRLLCAEVSADLRVTASADSPGHLAFDCLCLHRAEWWGRGIGMMVW